jgi:N,N'-diacetyllegionaminate synthase
MITNYQDILERAQSDLFIIGEAGVNHNGDLKAALKLVDVAIEAGCDAVKFQTWITEKVYSPKLSIKPDYQKETTNAEDSEYDTIKKLELSKNHFFEIKKYCDQKKILFLSTPDEIDSANFLVKELGVPLLKTASQDVTNLAFLKQVASFNIPVIFSTGACTLQELVEGLSTLKSVNDKILTLHCVSSYPAPIEQQNLKFISTLKTLTNSLVGYSDHTVGLYGACAALAYGAQIFEKHFTLDKNSEGPDHQASLSPQELKEYVQTLRLLYKGLGDGQKKVMPCESNTRLSFRRYIVAADNIKKGHKFHESDFNFKKVVKGIPSKYLDLIVGATAKNDINNDDVITWKDLEF